ncbi:hypothetical protein JZ751_013649 [Albula glossodonta]|uniref:Uncharacterized protein n=1 Tax=Albula glossodonta TaxID=121402 RepID=A0A8T2NRF3_9TELE|nr:hypothetical protein JZ751_013649 [Albula glossodonta]
MEADKSHRVDLKWPVNSGEKELPELVAQEEVEGRVYNAVGAKTIGRVMMKACFRTRRHLEEQVRDCQIEQGNQRILTTLPEGSLHLFLMNMPGVGTLTEETDWEKERDPG